MTMMAIDTQLAAIAKRVAARHGHRASDVYRYGTPLLYRLSYAEAEDLLTQVADLGKGMDFADAMGMLAEAADRREES